MKLKVPVVVPLLSSVWLFAAPGTIAHHVPLSFTISQVCSNSCPLHWWCYLTISFPAAPFSFCLQSFPASGTFPVSWLFASGGQSTEASASLRPSRKHSGPISPRIDQSDLPAVQESLRNPLQHHNSKASTLQTT